MGGRASRSPTLLAKQVGPCFNATSCGQQPRCSLRHSVVAHHFAAAQIVVAALSTRHSAAALAATAETPHASTTPATMPDSATLDPAIVLSAERVAGARVRHHRELRIAVGPPAERYRPPMPPEFLPVPARPVFANVNMDARGSPRGCRHRLGRSNDHRSPRLKSISATRLPTAGKLVAVL